jgi:iron complex outermembrane receptor protein
LGESSAPSPDIIVTAQKRPENLHEVPIAITVISGDALERANVTAATDIKRLATSVQYAENQSVRGTSLQIRGVGTQSFSNGLEQSVGTVVDGVVMARNGVGSGDLLDVDHVEVLRGPQGMLFGKKRVGGPGLDRLAAPDRRTERRSAPLVRHLRRTAGLRRS